MFNGPSGLAVNIVGDVFVCDLNNNLIRKVSSVGEFNNWVVRHVCDGCDVACQVWLLQLLEILYRFPTVWDQMQVSSLHLGWPLTATIYCLLVILETMPFELCSLQVRWLFFVCFTVSVDCCVFIAGSCSLGYYLKDSVCVISPEGNVCDSRLVFC